MAKTNLDIKQRAIAADVKLWQIGKALGMSDFTFSRKLREELPEDEKAKIFEIIDRLAGGEECPRE